MKVIEAIDIVDKLKPNTFSREDKLRWLSDLDGRVLREIIDVFLNSHTEFVPYNDEGLDRTLVIPFPYEPIYTYWMEAMIDYWNGEIDRYNNSIALFNSEFTAFKEDYFRNHSAKRERINYNGGWCHDSLPYPLSD